MSQSHVVPSFSWINGNNRPKAVLLCIHGLGLHGGAYRHFGQVMARRGIATYALDVRGFGRWAKTEACYLNFPACVQDIRRKVEEIRAAHPGVPLFLLGESLGGAISTRFAAEFPDSIDGLILCAPAREILDHKREILATLLHYLKQPTKKVCLATAVFHNAPNVVAVKNADPLVRTEFSINELLHLFNFLHGSRKMFSRLSEIPVLFIQGHGDALIKPRTTLRFFESIPTDDKDLVIIGDAQHLIFQYFTPPPKAINLVENWVLDHAPNNRNIRRVA